MPDSDPASRLLHAPPNCSTCPCLSIYFLTHVIFPVEISSTGFSLFFSESRRTSYLYSPGRIRQMLAVPPGTIADVHNCQKITVKIRRCRTGKTELRDKFDGYRPGPHIQPGDRVSLPGLRVDRDNTRRSLQNNRDQLCCCSVRNGLHSRTGKQQPQQSTYH